MDKGRDGAFLEVLMWYVLTRGHGDYGTAKQGKLCKDSAMICMSANTKT